MTALEHAAGPLRGTRVLDLCDGLGAATGLFLAELGAEVVLIEPPPGFESRRTEPLVGGVSIPFIVGNAGKDSVTLDLDSDEGRDGLSSLARTAAVVLVPSQARTRTLPTPQELLAENPALVVVSISPFGDWGPYQHFVPSEAVYMGLNGMVARSGRAGLDPLIPPRGLVESSAGLQAAWAAVSALHKARATGEGEHVDVSIFEASAQILDPPFGALGSARATIDPREGSTDPGRPDMGYIFPTVRCENGLVRIAALGLRQWLGLWECIGAPQEFAGEKYHDMHARFAAWPEIAKIVKTFFAAHSVEELMVLGAKHGFPIAEVYPPEQVLKMDHVVQRGVFVDFACPNGEVGKLATGLVEINGARWPREPAIPNPGRDNERLLASARGAAGPREVSKEEAGQGGVAPLPGSGPLAGLRILDLGVIVVGAETGRLFADLGADVVKVESLEYPDTMRAGSTGANVTVVFAWGHRNKRSLGLDLRSDEGRDLFKRLAGEADAVLSNFKPGTLDALGLGYQVLAEVNPRIVVAESSAYGATGPWAKRMGFGPLVRASVGLADLWRYPELAEGFGDDATVYPDHANGRVMATAVLASIGRARRSGVGCHVASAQAETVLNGMAAAYFQESLRPGTTVPSGNEGSFEGLPSLYRCAGADEWAIVDVQSAEQLRDLLTLALSPLAPTAGSSDQARLSGSAAVEAITAWTVTRTPYEVMWACQSLGIPAGPMLRPAEMLDDPHLRARGHFTTMNQAGLPALPSERGPAGFSSIPSPALAPAPLFGEHTREVLTEWLRLTSDELDRLAEGRILQAP